MLLENLMKFKDPLPEKFSETYKHKTAYTTSGDSQTLKAHIQIPGGGMVLTLDVFELLTCAKHHGDPTPNSTHYHTDHALPGTSVIKFSAQETPTQQHITS